MKKITFILLAILPLIGFAQFTVANPTFDSNTTEWVYNGNASGNISWENLDGNTTIGSLELVAAAVNDRAQTVTAVTPLLGNYSVSAWVKGPAGAQFQLAVFQGASGNNEFSGIFTIDVADDNAWTQYQYTASNLNDVGTRLRLIAKSVDTFYFDDIEVTQIVTERNLYVFDTDDDVEAWDERSGTNTGPASGILTFTPDADQFAKLVQEGYFIDASVNSHVRIVMQNLSTNDDQLRVIAPLGGNTTIAITTSDVVEQTYEIDLSGLVGWTGNVTGLELGFRDADNAAGSGRSSGTGAFLINSIEFFTPALPYIVTVADGNWNDTATWAGGTIPTALDDVQIEHNITLSGDQTAKDLTITAGNSVAMNKGTSLTVSGNLVTDAGANNSLVVRCDSNQFSSLIVEGTATGEIRFRRYVNDVETSGGNDLISSPVGISSFNDFYTDNASFFVEDPSSDAVLFGPFDNSAVINAYVNFESTDTGALVQGKGYRMGTNGTLAESLALNFHGTVETGTVNVPLTNPTGGSPWNLIGNPYSSYLNFKDFFDVLTDFDGTIVGTNNQLDPAFTAVYGYDSDDSALTGGSSNWTIWDFNNTGYSTDNITPGQGFFVRSKTGGGTASFTPAMRTIGTTDDFISGRTSSTNLAQIGLTLSNSSNTYTTNIYFRDFNSLGLDPGFDTGAYNQGALGIFTHLVEDNNGVQMVNQSLPYGDLSNIQIPLFVKSNQGVQVSFSLDAITDLPSNINVYLDDNVVNTSTLLNSGDYTITPNVNLNGAGRFYLRLTSNALSNSENQLDNIQILTLNESITISGILNTTTNMRLFDMQGRLVKTLDLDTISSIQIIDVSNLSAGVYIIELQGEKHKKVQKIMLNR